MTGMYVCDSVSKEFGDNLPLKSLEFKFFIGRLVSLLWSEKYVSI